MCQRVYFRYFGLVILFDSHRQPPNADVTNAWSPWPNHPEYLLRAAHINKCLHFILLSVNCVWSSCVLLSVAVRTDVALGM